MPIPTCPVELVHYDRIVPASSPPIVAATSCRAYHWEMERTYRELLSADLVLRQEPDDEEDEEQDNGGGKDDDGDEGYSE